jgi:hypothetical protein
MKKIALKAIFQPAPSFVFFIRLHQPDIKFAPAENKLIPVHIPLDTGPDDSVITPS